MVQIAQESGNVVPLIDGGTEGKPFCVPVSSR